MAAGFLGDHRVEGISEQLNEYQVLRNKVYTRRTSLLIILRSLVGSIYILAAALKPVQSSLHCTSALPHGSSIKHQLYPTQHLMTDLSNEIEVCPL